MYNFDTSFVFCESYFLLLKCSFTSVCGASNTVIIVIITHSISKLSSIRPIQTCYRCCKIDPSIISEVFSGLFSFWLILSSYVTVHRVNVFFQISSAFSKVLFVEFIVPILYIHKTSHITLIFVLNIVLQRNLYHQ